MAIAITPDLLTRDGAAIAPDLMTRDEAAAYLRVKRQTLSVWASSKRYDLPYVKVGRAVRYRRADLDRFIESRTVGGDDSAA